MYRKRSAPLGMCLLLCTTAALVAAAWPDRTAAVGLPTDESVTIASPGSFDAPVTLLGSSTVHDTWSGDTAECSDEGTLPVLAGCTWSTQGSFDPVGCMTGLLHAPLSSTSVAMGTDSDAYSLTVALVAGVGVVAGSMREDGATTTSASVTGIAILTPKPLQNCVAGISAFNGVLALQTTTPVVLPSPYPR
jgi:hypothetical protein